MNALAATHDAAVQMIDTSIIRVHQHAACIARNRRQSMGRSRGGLTSKIHALVDTNGLPIRLTNLRASGLCTERKGTGVRRVPSVGGKKISRCFPNRSSSRPRWAAPLVEPDAVFAHLLALRCRRVALAGRGLVALGRRAPTQLDAVVGVVRHLEVYRTVNHVA